MSIRFISSAEGETALEALGESFGNSDASFRAFEAKFLSAYESIFEAVSKIASVKESGRRGEAEITMSKWVEPSRGIGVVIANKSGLKRNLIPELQRVLVNLGGEFAVIIDDYPTVVYVLPKDDILVLNGSLPQDLLHLGIDALI